MKKILYFSSTLNPSGPINVLYEIIKHLDKKLYKPHLVTFESSKTSPMIHKFKEIGVEIHYVNLNKFNCYFKGFYEIQKVLNKVNPDLLHVQCFIFTVLIGFFFNKYKTIMTIHSDFEYDSYHNQGAIIGFIMTFLYKKAIEKIKNNVCVSEITKKILEKKFKNLKLTYIDNGIDTEKFTPVENKINLRKELSLPLDKKIFIWTGVLIDRKNPQLLIRLINELKINDIYFVICGDGYLKQQLQDNLKNNTNVLFTGNVNNIEEYLQASDYYISTSLLEGLPLSVLEALACGLPILVSNIEQHKYIFRDENIGFTFESQNLESFVDNFNKLLKIDYQTSSKNANKLVLDKFSSSVMSRKYQELYRIIVEKE